MGIATDRAEELRAAPAAARTLRRPAQQQLTLRDKAILCLLTETGPRVAEVCGANREAIRTHEETARPVLRVLGKGSKTRDLPLSALTVEAIEDYLANERPTTPTAEDPRDPVQRARIQDARRALFVTVRGWRMNARDVQRMVDRHARTLGIRVTPHGLRHTALTILARSGVDIATVADIAGHESLSTTSRYMDKSALAAADAVDHSPLAMSPDRPPLQSDEPRDVLRPGDAVGARDGVPRGGAAGQ
ncbi:tyrosine-type recombinase/integrase [Luedemannella flava]